MIIEQEKFLPEIHQQLLYSLESLVLLIKGDESIASSVMMPIVVITRMLGPENTLEQGGLCLRQIAHCCRIMGFLDHEFYHSSLLYKHCQRVIDELGEVLGWYPSTIIHWQQFAKGRNLII